MVESAKKLMNAVVYTAPGEYSYSHDVKEIPTPGPGEVLIRVECAVINPTDTYQMAGQYTGTYEYPVTLGLEGSGTVIESGGGFYAWTLTGKRVSFSRINERRGLYTRGGTYADYCVTKAVNCIPIADNVTFEQAASGVINPLTALGLMERIQDKWKAQAAIQTAGASQMGRMMIKLCQQAGIPMISIVRKEDQAQMLRDKYGSREEQGNYVLNSEVPGFEQELKALAKKLNAAVVLECIAGPILGQISRLLPPKSTIICYGQLSEQKISGIDAHAIIAKGLVIESFILSHYVSSKSIFGIYSVIGKAGSLLDEVIVSKEYGLHQIHEAMAEYKANMGKGKVLLKPSLTVKSE